MAIQNPPVWLWERFRRGTALAPVGGQRDDRPVVPVIRQIGFADLRQALSLGLADFGAIRTDIIFLCVVYPVFGLVLGRVVSGYGLIELLFPLASGFALVGPVAAVGLNELSRRREAGLSVGWLNTFDVLRSPSLGSILMLAGVLVGMFLAWLQVAELLYAATLGTTQPASLSEFAQKVLRTKAGWSLMFVGVSVGFVFALVVLCISAVSFPMLLDRKVGIEMAVMTSIRVVLHNPGTMASWGFIVAALLVAGSLPLFLGLVVVLPVLGHATWHLYRHAVSV